MMADYFDKTDLSGTDASQLVNTPDYAGTETLVFPTSSAASRLISGSLGQLPGTLLVKLDSSDVGTQIAALPDVVELVDGTGAPVMIADEVTIEGLAVYAMLTETDSSGAVIDESLVQLASANPQSDTVLPASYPGIAVLSYFAKIIVPAAPADYTDAWGYRFHYGALYLGVEGARTDGFLETLGLTDPNEGRLLLAQGQVGGQRDAEWSHWVNPVAMVPPTDPWNATVDPTFTGVDTYSQQSDSTGAVTTSISGISFDAAGDATWQDGSAPAQDWSVVSTAIKALVAQG